jgi:GUN4-like
VKFIPDQDLQTIDALWKAASGGKFGYSVQKEVWMQQSKYWSRFFKKIDWTQVCWVLHTSHQRATSLHGLALRAFERQANELSSPVELA